MLNALSLISRHDRGTSKSLFVAELSAKDVRDYTGVSSCDRYCGE